MYYRVRGAATGVDVDRAESIDSLDELHAQHDLGDVLTQSANKRGDSFETLAIDTSLSASASHLDLAVSRAGIDTRFVLSPNTRMSITFTVDLNADSVPGESEFATARAWLSVINANATRPYPGELRFLQTYSENSLAQGEGEAGVFSYSGIIGAGDTAQVFLLAMNADSSISPVPERSTYAMMFAGLLVAGAAYSRRR